ncbi:hypothetical protein F183_A11450 [Bryobacterales bacterium F-183]|nr:hypothetical protein F183_A11450 [Bryobacterales bacterium F-183]
MRCFTARLLLFAIGIAAAGQDFVVPFFAASPAFSPALGKLVILRYEEEETAAPYLYDPATRALEQIPGITHAKGLSVSPDGRYAAVSTRDGVRIVNLITRAIERTIPVERGFVVMANEWVHFVPTASVRVSTGERVPFRDSYFGEPVLGPGNRFLYANNGTEALRINVSTGPMTGSVETAAAQRPPCSAPPTFPAIAGAPVLFDWCGNMFANDAELSKDLRYTGTLAPPEAFSAAGPNGPVYAVQSSPRTITLYRGAPFLEPYAAFEAGPGFFAFNREATELYAVRGNAQGTITISTMSLTAEPNCTAASFGDIPSLRETTGAGVLSAIAVLAPTESCRYTIASDVPWIKIVGPSLLAGNQGVRIQIEPNTTGALRSGSVRLTGGAQYVVQQDPLVRQPLQPFGLPVVSAVFNKARGTILFAPGDAIAELRVYDPASGVASAIALPLPPTAVGVTPDGRYAAAGHNGWVSLVDLESGDLLRTYEMALPVNQVLIPGNGYVYAFSDQIRQAYAMHLETGATSPFEGGLADPPMARVSVERQLLYWRGFRFSIASGVPERPQRVGCTSAVISENGNRRFGCGYIYAIPNPLVSGDEQLVGSLLQGGDALDHSATQHAVLTADQFRVFRVVDETNGTTLGQLTLPGPMGPGQVLNYAFWSRDGRIFVLVRDVFDQNSWWAVAEVQSPVSCRYAFSQESVDLPAEGGERSISIATGEGCAWRVEAPTAQGAPRLTGPNAEGGIGPGAVTVQVPPNPLGQPRRFTLALRGNYNVGFTVQQPANSGRIVLAPEVLVVEPGGGPQTVNVTPTNAALQWWTAAPLEGASWVRVDYRIAIYTGPGTVQLQVEPNLGAALRQTVISIGGTPLTVLQRGTATPPYPGPPPVTYVPALGGSAVIRAEASPREVPVSSAEWLSVRATDASNGTYSVTVSAATNPTSRIRSALLQVGATLHTVVQTAQTGGHFYPLKPCRFADTRAIFGAPIAAKSERTFYLPAGTCGIPAGAIAYSLTVTAIPKGKLESMTVYASGDGRPPTPQIYSPDGTMRINSAFVRAGERGGVTVYATDEADVAIDINGYIADLSLTGLGFQGRSGCRILDTRVEGGILRAGSSIRLSVAPNCGVPAEARAYAVNVTAIPIAAPVSVAVGPASDGVALPVVHAPGAFARAASTIVSPGQSGQIEITANADTHVTLDLLGIFVRPSERFSAFPYYALPPCRVRDETFRADEQRNIGMDIVCGGSVLAGAVAANITATADGPLDQLRIWPPLQRDPGFPFLSLPAAGGVASNGALLQMSSLPTGLTIFSSGRSRILVEASGVFGVVH